MTLQQKHQYLIPLNLQRYADFVDNPNIYQLKEIKFSDDEKYAFVCMD